jgi:cell division protein ZapA (FtsZ GTPase activity inhibitor)
LEELAEDVTASVRVTYGVSALLERKIAEINAAIAELQARDDARVTKALTDATERLERGATACEEAARHFAQTAENLHRMTETLGNLNQAMETTTRLSRLGFHGRPTWTYGSYCYDIGGLAHREVSDG